MMKRYNDGSFFPSESTANGTCISFHLSVLTKTLTSQYMVTMSSNPNGVLFPTPRPIKMACIELCGSGHTVQRPIPTHIFPFNGNLHAFFGLGIDHCQSMQTHHTPRYVKGEAEDELTNQH